MDVLPVPKAEKTLASQRKTEDEQSQDSAGQMTDGRSRRLIPPGHMSSNPCKPNCGIRASRRVLFGNVRSFTVALLRVSILKSMNHSLSYPRKLEPAKSKTEAYPKGFRRCCNRHFGKSFHSSILRRPSTFESSLLTRFLVLNARDMAR